MCIQDVSSSVDPFVLHIQGRHRGIRDPNEDDEIRSRYYEAVFAAAAAKEQRYDGCCRAVGVKID